MKAINKARFPVIVNLLVPKRWCSPDILVQSGETKEVIGPQPGELGEGSSRAIMGGTFVVHEGPEGILGHHVGPGLPFRHVEKGWNVLIRHYLDEPDRQVKAWRGKKTPPVQLASKSA